MNGALAGKRIVNTRAVHQAETFSTLLRERGAVPIHYPCIAITSPTEMSALDVTLKDLAAGHFDWLILTSANTVSALSERLRTLDLAVADIGFKSAAVGPKTAEAARQLGLSISEFPEEYLAEALAASLPGLNGARVLLPQSSIAPPVLAEMLAAQGANVTVVTAYRPIYGAGGADLPRLLAQRQIDALAFTSASTVTGFCHRLQNEGGSLQDVLTLPAACIGPKTAAAALDCGFTPLPIPSEYTLEGIIAALNDFFSQPMFAKEES